MTISTPARLLGNARACIHKAKSNKLAMRRARSVVPRAPRACMCARGVWHTPDKELLINRRAVQSFDHFGVWHSRIMGIMARDGAVIDGRDQICTSLSATPTWTSRGPAICDIFHIHFCTSHASLSQSPHAVCMRVRATVSRCHYWKLVQTLFRVNSDERYFYFCTFSNFNNKFSMSVYSYCII